MDFERLNKLAALFYKTADEVDSTNLGFTIRPVVENLLPQLKAMVSKIVQQAATKNNDLSGDITIGKAFFTNAKKEGDNWMVLQTQIKADGSLLQDKRVGPAIEAVVNQFNTLVKAPIQKELNRMKNSLGGGETITNHETAVASFSFGVGDAS
ncbi:MAG TPA: hypothetical protein VNX68_04010 [Nitrosopumilaceae archaeon]|jgi:hypothetical protein|nr:hypothetical protein [Nitrosopumilaceae archaeon]